MPTELEVKFLLSSLEGMTELLASSGAVLEAPRILERNLRFDTPDRALAHRYEVLRLRQDARSRVTFKSSGRLEGGILARKEIEFAVDHFEAAQELFEALGYEVSFVYEKYRTTYLMGTSDGSEVEIVLDETPLGVFTEIEGANTQAIQSTASRLGLDWKARINESYANIFEEVKKSLSLPFRDLTFANFEGIHVPPEAFKAQFGD